MPVICFQVQLLDDHIKELKRVLRPGHKRLNWNSLGIQVQFVLQKEYNFKQDDKITKLNPPQKKSFYYLYPFSYSGVILFLVGLHFKVRSCHWKI